MTKKQRVIATINGEKTDYLPFHSDMTSAVRKKLARHYNIRPEAVEDKINNHIVYCSYRSSNNSDKAKKLNLSEGLYFDEFGILWNNENQKNIGDVGILSHPVKDLDFKDYIWPNEDSPGRFDGIEEQIKPNADKFITLGLSGLFDTAWRVTGMEDALAAMADSDSTVINHMLDNSLAFLIGIVRQIPPGLMDSVRFVEDWGCQRGLMMGIHNWRKHLKPRLKELYGEVHKKGLYVHSHSCGDNSELYGDLIEMGVNISDPLQPEVMDIEKIKQRFGNDITFMGGLPCQSLIVTGNAGEVYNVTKKTCELLKKGGRYILGGAGAFSADTPVENILAIVDFYEELTNTRQ
jgi:uroporphyrinogen decarboxylase